MAATSVLDDTTVMGAWLRQEVPVIPANKINTVLPDVALWADTGFVQLVGVVGGTPWIDAPVHDSVFEVDTWGAHLNSEKPDWGKASRLMYAILAAVTEPSTSTGVRVTVGTEQAQIIAMRAVSSPRKPLAGIDQGDASSFARLMIEIGIIWARVPD